MDLLKAMEQRHSVRCYNDRKIDGEVKEKLEQKIRECNEESGLHMQIVCNEPSAFDVNPGEKLSLVIAIGYGKTNGTAHRSKAGEEVCKVNGNMPEWFKKGIEASLLAPTAMNQQKYKFILKGNKVSAVCGNGFYTKIVACRWMILLSVKRLTVHSMKNTVSGAMQMENSFIQIWRN